MPKRIVSLIIALIMIICCASCEGGKVTSSDTAASDDIVTHTRSNLFGFAVQSDGTDAAYEAMHSFIVTCADVGVNAKLYTFSDSDDPDKLTGDITADNCDCVLFYSKDTDCAGAAASLEKNGIRTVSLLREDDAFSCAVVTSDCTRDITELMIKVCECEEVLIYSSADFDTDSLEKALNDDGIKVKIHHFKRTEYSYRDAQSSLQSYLTDNTGIKAIYAIGEQNARPAVYAAKAIGGIKVTGSEITAVNKGLFSDGLYALCVTPYYEMTAKAVYAMRSLQSGETLQTDYCTVHIVTRDNLDDYTAISENAKKWFMG